MLAVKGFYREVHSLLDSVLSDTFCGPSRVYKVVPVFLLEPNPPLSVCEVGFNKYERRMGGREVVLRDLERPAVGGRVLLNSQ